MTLLGSRLFAVAVAWYAHPPALWARAGA